MPLFPMCSRKALINAIVLKYLFAKPALFRALSIKYLTKVKDADRMHLIIYWLQLAGGYLK